jgi:hypothetical protein
VRAGLAVTEIKKVEKTEGEKDEGEREGEGEVVEVEEVVGEKEEKMEVAEEVVEEKEKEEFEGLGLGELRVPSMRVRWWGGRINGKVKV